MSDIGKIRAYHDISEKFELSEEIAGALAAQLHEEDRVLIPRFRAGFEVEKWFAAIFCSLPWSKLIHGLDQQQYPHYSKAEYQVPDFLALVENSALEVKPILIEVKRVKGQSITLRLRENQFQLSQTYAREVGLPLLYGTYWDRFNAWTVNAPDSFTPKASTRTISIAKAAEFDCSLIFGDINYLFIGEMKRVQVFDRNGASDTAVRHVDFGVLTSDKVFFEGKTFQLRSLESAALDAIGGMATVETVRQGDQTTIFMELDGTHAVKLSGWVTRNLGLYSIAPDVNEAHTFVKIVDDLATRLGIHKCHLFPWGRSADAQRLEGVFFKTKKALPPK